MEPILIVITVGYLLGTVYLANLVDGNRDDKVVSSARTLLAYPYAVQSNDAVSTEQTQMVVHDENDKWRTLHQLMLGGLLGIVALNGFAVFATSIIPGITADMPEMTHENALSVGVVSQVAAMLGGLMLFSGRFRQWFAERLGRHGAFRPTSTVHRTAFVLGVLLLANTFITVLQLGGVQGLAEEYADQPIGQWDAVLNLFGMVAVALLGVGWLVRRNWSHTRQRLDLRFPTMDDAVWGLGTAFACLVLIFVFVSLLTVLLPLDVIENQGAASNQIATILSQSLWIAFLAAASAAIGEEILFRGALQPVFGIIPTTLFFALLHSQYALTPSSIAIILVGGAFGWLKQRQSTTAAIIAHFAYNFVLLGMAYLAMRLEEMGFTPESLEGMVFFVGM
jgi:membrane protease YdiL (CAAX protease family)